MLNVNQLIGFGIVVEGAVAISYKYWQQGAANNGRPYWGLSSTSSGVLPTGTLAPSGSDWGCMIDLGSIQAWDTCTFTFAESHGSQDFEVVVSDVATGAVYGNVVTASGSSLTITRSSFGMQGSVGTGISSVPSSARYFGFGEGDSGETFSLTGVSIA
jgi:hypothetical protein